MTHSVRLALRDTGGRNTVIPLLIASMPVRAVQPAANVCRSRRLVTGIPAVGMEVQLPGPWRNANPIPARSMPPARSCRPAPAGLAPKSRGLLIGSAAGPSRYPADPQFVARSLSWYTWDYSAGGTGARPRAASRRRAVQHGAPIGPSGSSARSGQGSASLTAVSRIRRVEWAADSDIPIGAAAHPAPRAAQAAPRNRAI
jgi:hypothetical protein